MIFISALSNKLKWCLYSLRNPHEYTIIQYLNLLNEENKKNHTIKGVRFIANDFTSIKLSILYIINISTLYNKSEEPLK